MVIGIGLVSFFFIPFVWIPIVACFIVWVIITLCFCCCKSKCCKKEPVEDAESSTSSSSSEKADEADEPGDENDAFNPEDPLNSEEQQTANLAAKAIDAELTLTEIIQNPVKGCSKWFWVTGKEVKII